MNLVTRVVLAAFDPTLQKPLDTLTADIQKIAALCVAGGAIYIAYHAWRHKKIQIIPAFILVVAFMGLMVWSGGSVMQSLGAGAKAFLGLG